MEGDKNRQRVEADYDGASPARSNRTQQGREQRLTRAGTA
jgi:hypothetical protein